MAEGEPGAERDERDEIDRTDRFTSEWEAENFDLWRKHLGDDTMTGFGGRGPAEYRWMAENPPPTETEREAQFQRAAKAGREARADMDRRKQPEPEGTQEARADEIAYRYRATADDAVGPLRETEAEAIQDGKYAVRGCYEVQTVAVIRESAPTPPGDEEGRATETREAWNAGYSAGWQEGRRPCSDSEPPVAASGGGPSRLITSTTAASDDAAGELTTRPPASSPLRQGEEGTAESGGDSEGEGERT